MVIFFCLAERAKGDSLTFLECSVDRFHLSRSAPFILY